MRIKFGEFELDEERFCLHRAGRAVSIRPKVFDLLAYLVRHRERVVLREELVDALWGSTVVCLGSLSGLVNELRSALGESVVLGNHHFVPGSTDTDANHWRNSFWGY